MQLSPAQIDDIIATEIEKAFRGASETNEVPNSRLDGRLLILEWLGQIRSFTINPDATAEKLRARVASSLSAMFAMAGHPSR
jgi:hypothetical protein